MFKLRRTLRKWAHMNQRHYDMHRTTRQVNRKARSETQLFGTVQSSFYDIAGQGSRVLMKLSFHSMEKKNVARILSYTLSTWVHSETVDDFVIGLCHRA